MLENIFKAVQEASRKLTLLKEEKVVNAERDSFSSVLFSGYKKYGKLTYYSEMKLGNNGSYQTATIEKLLVNAGVSVQDFK